MKISVSNIGLINRADIELDGITVIGRDFWKNMKRNAV
jgi:hypothetical protein